MIFDSYGCIVMDGPDPGHLGDSCAETSRWVCLGGELDSKILEQFISHHGYLRHPDAPYGPPRSLHSWRESDMSSDQLLPLLMAAQKINPMLAETIKARLQSTWMVGPGHIAPPALLALAYGNLWWFKQLTQLQTYIFKIPWRWSDSKKWFERTEGSSADFLNYFISIVYLKRHGIVVKYDVEKVREKIVSYYANQVNSDWVVAKYLENFS